MFGINTQKFVTDVIEALGGIVIPLEYALCQAMVPESNRELFQGRTELQLAFDFEVAEENPQAEFVTFGSYLFEQIVAIAQRQAIGTIRFVDTEVPALSGATDKIRRFLGHDAGALTVEGERVVQGVWAAFALRISYVSDEKEQEYRQIWVSLNRGEVCGDMMHSHHLVSYVDKPVHHHPITCPLDLAVGLNIACEYAKDQAEAGRLSRMNQGELDREIQRINSYYEELAQDTAKRSQRKGLSDQKKQELLDKAQSIGLEQQKQLREIEDKYSVRVEIGLDHGILIAAPLLEYVVSIRQRHENKTMTLHYNPIVKQFHVVPPRP